MKNRKNLTLAGLVGVLALGSAGCGAINSQTSYDGEIGEDHVTFTRQEYIFTSDNFLTVTKADGRVIVYVDDLNDDLRLEYVEITTDGQTTKYTAKDEVGMPILEEAQNQFDDYLRLIIEIRTNEGLENLK